MEKHKILNQGLLKEIIKGSDNINTIDIIHDKFIEFNKQCSEYLATISNSQQSIKIPIPIKYCFQNITLLDEKIIKIREYINYINSSNLFNIEILEDNSLFENYFNESILEGADNILDLYNYIIDNRIVIDEEKESSVKSFSHLTDEQMKSFIKNLKFLLKKDYNDLIKEDSDYYMILTNSARFSTFYSMGYSCHFLNFFSKGNNLFYTYGNLLDDYLNIENYNLHEYKNIKFDDIDSSLQDILEKIPINEDYFNNKKCFEIISYISKKYYEYCYSINQNDYNSIMYEKYDALFKFTTNQLLSKNSTRIIESIKEELKEQILFVNIKEKDKDIIKTGKRLLIYLTIIRYLFFHKYEHIAEILLKLKDYDISVLNNLFISSSFHNKSAWYRYNLVSCWSSSNLKYTGDEYYNYYQYPGDEYIYNKLTGKNHVNINYIFSPESSFINIDKNIKILLYNKITELYNSEKYDELIDLFNNLSLNHPIVKEVKKNQNKKINIKKITNVKFKKTNTNYFKRFYETNRKFYNNKL